MRCYHKHWDISTIGTELFILQMICMRKVVEIKGRFAVISQQGSIFSLKKAPWRCWKRNMACLTICPTYRGGLLQRHYLTCAASARTHTAHFRTRRGLSVCACICWALTPCRREHLTTSLSNHGVLANASTINLRYWSDVGGVRRGRQQTDR